MVVVAVISILTVVAIPRLTTYLNSTRNNFSIFTGIITRTFDDSFLNQRINYLVIHLAEAGLISDEDVDELLSKDNGLSVVNLIDGKFVAHERKILKYKNFSGSFKIDEVILSNGEVITEGSVLVPFYPQGFSDNIIIHILVDSDEKYSVRIFKHKKEPKVITGYIFNEKVY